MPPIPNLGKTLMRRLDATFASLTGSWRHRMAGLGKVHRPTVQRRCRGRGHGSRENQRLRTLTRLLCDRRHFSITPSSIASGCSRQHGPAQGGARRQIGEYRAYYHHEQFRHCRCPQPRLRYRAASRGPERTYCRGPDSPRSGTRYKSRFDDA